MKGSKSGREGGGGGIRAKTLKNFSFFLYIKKRNYKVVEVFPELEISSFKLLFDAILFFCSAIVYPNFSVNALCFGITLSVLGLNNRNENSLK